MHSRKLNQEITQNSHINSATVAHPQRDETPSLAGIPLARPEGLESPTF